jgi:arylsulfatase A-like enzyme
MNYYDYLDGYDEEIRYVDEAMRQVIEQLKRKGLWDDALVIFTADHGESFGEHGIFFDHRKGLWEATTRVPLIIRIGGDDGQKEFKPQRVSSISSPMDLMPTILDYLDISFEGRMDGQSLLEILKGQEKHDRMFFLELPRLSTPYGPDPWPDTYSVRTTTHKLVRVFGPDTGQLKNQAVFDITKDPMEQKPLPYDKTLQTHREMAEYMDDMLAKVREYKLPFTLTTYEVPLSKRKHFVEERKDQREMIFKQFSDEQVENLRSLGYVD